MQSNDKRISAAKIRVIGESRLNPIFIKQYVGLATRQRNGFFSDLRVKQLLLHSDSKMQVSITVVDWLGGGKTS